MEAPVAPAVPEVPVASPENIVESRARQTAETLVAGLASGLGPAPITDTAPAPPEEEDEEEEEEEEEEEAGEEPTEGEESETTGKKKIFPCEYPGCLKVPRFTHNINVALHRSFSMIATLSHLAIIIVCAR